MNKGFLLLPTLLLANMFFPSNVFASQDNVFYIEMQNDYLYESGTFNYQEIGKDFYQTNDDVYDVLVFYTAFTDTSLGSAAAYSLPVKQEVDGIGKGAIWDQSSSYGSNGRLLSIVSMKNISRAQSEMGPFTFSTLFHEIGHQWTGSVKAIIQDPSIHLTSEDNYHWNEYLEIISQDTGIKYLSPLGGNAFTGGQDGI